MGMAGYLPGEIVAMTATAAERILKIGNGDVALLYIHLLRTGGVFTVSSARGALGWADDRVRTAFDLLSTQGLADRAQETETKPIKPEPDEPPAYSAADLMQELERPGPFPHLVKEVQQLLGKVLSTMDLQMLFTLYDYLSLPAEVVFLLTAWCVEECQRKYGSGRKPSISQIRKEGFVWRRLGVDTIEAADAHVKALSQLRDRERSILPLLGISGRHPVEGERNYISAWVEMGFDDDTIRLAYEKTVLKKQTLNWAYMNSILKNWHQKNIHTPEQVETGDSAYHRTATMSQTTQREPARLIQEMDWMDRFLQETDDKKGDG